MIKIQSTTERIESKGGLLLAGKIASAAGLLEIKSSAQKKAGEIITSIFALMVEGKSNFESMGEKRSSLFFKEALGLSIVFAKKTIRIYLKKIAQDLKNIIEQLHESTLKIIKETKLTGYFRQFRQRADVSRGAIGQEVLDTVLKVHHTPCRLVLPGNL